MINRLITTVLALVAAVSMTGCASLSSTQQKSDIVVSVADQVLYLKQGEKIVKTYLVSTSRFGVGEQVDSWKTPRGLHLISEKIGAGEPLGRVFRDRVPLAAHIKLLGTPPPINTRILWLAGKEPHNENTKDRYIYIHGAPQEDLLGYPASAGCVRMSPKDVLELFDLVEEGTPVRIIEEPYLQFVGPPQLFG
jgi:lipoprotein-anchoring transpeptidase ErfK/SrfK